MRHSMPLRSATLLLAACLLSSCAISEEQKVTYGTFRGGAGAAAWSPDGAYFAVAGTSGIWVFSTETLEERTVFTSPAAPGSETKYNVRHGWGNSLVFLDDGRIATTGMGAAVTLWNVESGQEA